MEDVTSDVDTDFHYFHCSIEGCHDISMGKTSFPCGRCGVWICQGCSVEHMKDTFLGDLCCLNCCKKSKKKK